MIICLFIVTFNATLQKLTHSLREGECSNMEMVSANGFCQLEDTL